MRSKNWIFALVMAFAILMVASPIAPAQTPPVSITPTPGTQVANKKEIALPAETQEVLKKSYEAMEKAAKEYLAAQVAVDKAIVKAAGPLDLSTADLQKLQIAKDKDGKYVLVEAPPPAQSGPPDKK